MRGTKNDGVKIKVNKNKLCYITYTQIHYARTHSLNYTRKTYT